MSELECFMFGQWKFRYTMIDGKPWFVVIDICAALDLGNPSQALAGFPGKDRGQIPLISSEGSNRTLITNIVNEPGMWRLIFKSRKPDAEQFKTLMFEEVLPALREHGYYSVNQHETPELAMPDSLEAWDRIPSELLLAMVKLKEEREQDKAAIAEMEQPARAYQIFLSADGLSSVADVAKSLRRDLNIETGFGQNRLFIKLGDLGWVYRDRGDGKWRASQRAIDAGRLRQRENYLTTRNGERRRTAPTVLFTQKGRHDLWTILRNPLGAVAAIEDGELGNLALPERLA